MGARGALPTLAALLTMGGSAPRSDSLPLYIAFSKGENLKKFNMGGSAPRSDSLPLYIAFSKERIFKKLVKG